MGAPFTAGTTQMVENIARNQAAERKAFHSGLQSFQPFNKIFL
jgi:hypothetical protein